MSTATLTPEKIVHYPDSDGQPMADNTLQFDVLTTLKWNIEACYRDVPQVFTGGDLLIYPVKGHPEIRVAPDVLVAFGRPRGYRGSYKVWEEDDIFPQVVIEVWSPNNRPKPMRKKFEFYERYGAEEYYIVYPEHPADVEGWLRHGDELKKIEAMNGFLSPRLQMRFGIKDGELSFIGPDGRHFSRPDEAVFQRNTLEREAKAAQERAENEKARAEAEKVLSEKANARAEAEKARAEAERARAEALAAKLRALGIDPNAP